jgi:hypothetical protein
MASEAVDQLMDRWLNEPGFKDAMLADPSAALQGAGLDLSDEDWAAVRSVVSGLSDEALPDRVSKDLPPYPKN